jgi:hypothetical protein
MSNIEQKLTEMRNGFTAVGEAVEAIANQPAPKAVILDRGLSGNKINGGTITNFKSTGITDTATSPTLLVANDGVTITVLRVNSIANPLTVQGNLTVQGEITATRLHVDEISADIRNERTGPLEFLADAGGIYGKGLIWKGSGSTRQLTMQGSPDRIFSSESIDVFRDKDYRINNTPVLTSTNLGLGVINSNLQTVGTLENLTVFGRVNIDDHVVYDPDSMRLGLGTSEPNGAFSIASLDHEFTIDHNEIGTFSIGTWTTSELSIITDNTCRIHIEPTGNITLHNKVKVEGKLGINVNNFNSDADITTAGPIRIQGKKIEVGSDIPESGVYIKGDIIYNSNPRPTGYVGWVCVRDGTPGEWKAFGQIAA